jgi:hypothetical protein
MHLLIICVAVVGISFLGLAVDIPKIKLSQFAISETPTAQESVDLAAVEYYTGYAVVGVYNSKTCDGATYFEDIVSFGQCILTNDGWLKLCYTSNANTMTITHKMFSDPGCTNLIGTQREKYPTKCSKNDQKGTFIVARHYKKLPTPPTGGFYRL